jgi:hypothetical protein
VTAAVFNYDKPIQNFIAELDKTGHVTHVAYRKTSVTFHHNGGRLSLRGILDVWKVRPASAQFQVDGQGAVGQYVRLNEYAWATGNTQGNKESISIELANATLGPDWTVAEVTWREGARLCGAIHYKVLGVRPSRKTVKMHQDWKSTTCPGPFIKPRLSQIIAEAQRAYDNFAKAAQTNDNTGPKEDASMSAAEVKDLKDYVDTAVEKAVSDLKKHLDANFGEKAVDNPNAYLNTGVTPRLMLNLKQWFRGAVDELRSPTSLPEDHTPAPRTIGD